MPFFLIPGRISIDARPDLVNARQRFGDWEGDTVEGAKGSGHITTHVERKSRYLIAAKLANKTATVTLLRSPLHSDLYLERCGIR